MRIGIDVSLAVGEIGGGGRYAAELVEALSTIDHENEYLLFPLFLFIRHPEWKRYRGPAAANFRVWGEGYSAEEGIRFWQDPAQVGKLLATCDVLHTTTFSVPKNHPGVVSTLYDLTFVTLPECHLEANRTHCLQGTIDSVLRARRIISISNYTASDLDRYLNARPPQVVTIPLGVNGRFFRPVSESAKRAALERYAIRPPYVLTVGSLEPRKNIAGLVEAWANLPNLLRSSYRLVVAGGKGWLNSAVHRRISDLGLGDSVLLIGYVEDDDLPALYQGATVFAFPSLSEGFGLPVAEAMAGGVPVLTSDTTSLLELGKGAAELVNPADPESIGAGLERLLSDSGHRSRLSEAGRGRSAEMTWEKVARRTLNVYSEVNTASSVSEEVSGSEIRAKSL